MFKSSRVSVGKAKVISVNVVSKKTTKVLIEYTPFKRERSWQLLFELTQEKNADATKLLLDYLYQGILLDTEIAGLGSWLPLIDNIKYALGYTLIKIDESDVRTLEPFAKPVVS